MVYSASIWDDDGIVASVLAVPVAPSLNQARGAGLGQITAHSELFPSLSDGVSATTLNTAAKGTVPSAPPCPYTASWAYNGSRCSDALCFALVSLACRWD